MRELNWNKVGVARDETGLKAAIQEIDEIAQSVKQVAIKGIKAYNMVWNHYIDLLNMIDVSRMVAHSALLRRETRGAHFRTDYPEQDDQNWMVNLYQKKGEDSDPVFEQQRVVLDYMTPGDL